MIVISPYSKKLRNGKENPKNYPYWEELIQKIDKSIHIVQVGVEGETKLVDDCRFNLSVIELRNLINECQTWISCDSMFQHLAWSEGKQGIVLWSVSDPLIYGHPENINLLKNRSYLVQNQFLWWDSYEFNPDAFVKPEEVVHFLK